MKILPLVVLSTIALVAAENARASCGGCGSGCPVEAKPSPCSSGACGLTAQTAKPACGDAGAKPYCSKASPETAKIDTSSLKVLVRSGAATILDARTGKWDDGRRIPGAKALGPGATPDQAEKAIKSKDSLVVTYCSNVECPASGKLAARLKALGYQHVIEYPKGIDGWEAAGNNVEQAE